MLPRRTADHPISGSEVNEFDFGRETRLSRRSPLADPDDAATDPRRSRSAAPDDRCGFRSLADPTAPRDAARQHLAHGCALDIFNRALGSHDSPTAVVLRLGQRVRFAPASRPSQI